MVSIGTRGIRNAESGMDCGPSALAAEQSFCRPPSRDALNLLYPCAQSLTCLFATAFPPLAPHAPTLSPSLYQFPPRFTAGASIVNSNMKDGAAPIAYITLCFVSQSHTAACTILRRLTRYLTLISTSVGVRHLLTGLKWSLCVQHS